MNSKEYVDIIVKAIEDKKGQDIKVFDANEISGLADYFIIATGSSSTNIKAISDNVKEGMHLSNLKLYHTEGGKGDDWILIDFGDVVVHIMSKKLREFYGLERLWEKRQ